MSYYNTILSDDKTAFLVELDRSGMLSKLYRHGIITTKPKIIIEARLKAVQLMRQGISKSKACSLISSYLSVDKRTVYKYLRE